MTEPVPATVGTVMLDCIDPDVLIAFWSEILGLEEKARYPDFVWMSPISDGGPALAFQRVPEEACQESHALRSHSGKPGGICRTGRVARWKPSYGPRGRRLPLDGDGRPRGQRVLHRRALTRYCMNVFLTVGADLVKR